LGPEAADQADENIVAEEIRRKANVPSILTTNLKGRVCVRMPAFTFEGEQW